MHHTIAGAITDYLIHTVNNKAAVARKINWNMTQLLKKAEERVGSGCFLMKGFCYCNPCFLLHVLGCASYLRGQIKTADTKRLEAERKLAAQTVELNALTEVVEKAHLKIEEVEESSKSKSSSSAAPAIAIPSQGPRLSCASQRSFPFLH